MTAADLQGHEAALDTNYLEEHSSSSDTQRARNQQQNLEVHHPVVV